MEYNFPTGHPKVTRSLNNLAALLRRAGRFPEAEALYRKVVAIDEDPSFAIHPDKGCHLSNLGVLLMDLGRYDEAEPMLKKGLELSEAELGLTNTGVAVPLNNLAVLFNKMGRPLEAEPLLKRALEIYESAYGPDHPKVATSLNNLAMYYRETHRLPEAESLLRRLVDIYSKALDENHPDIALAINNLETVREELAASPPGLEPGREPGGPPRPKIVLEFMRGNQKEKAEISEILKRHYSSQVAKAKAAPEVLPGWLVLACDELFERELNNIAEEVLASFLSKSPDHYRYFDRSHGIFMLITFLPWSTEEAVGQLAKMSTEPPFGYINLFTNRIINNWPSDEMKFYNHVIICCNKDGSIFNLHSVWGDYGGSPTSPREFTILPVDLLNRQERQMLNL